MPEEMNLDQLTALLAETAAMVKAITETQAINEVELKEAQEEVTDLSEQLHKARTKRDRLDGDRRSLKNSLSEAELRLQQLDRLIAQERANEEAARRAAERRAQLDALTANAPWRDRALPHQLDGAHYLSASRRAVCADVMGLGKTLQGAVITLDMLEAANEGGKKNLIIVPNEVLSGFQKEIERWAPDRALIMLGGIGGLKKAQETHDFVAQVSPNEVTYVTNYELLRRKSSSGFVDSLILDQFDTVICDEAHKMKETDKPTFKVVKKIVHAYNTCPVEGCGKVILPTKRDHYDPTKDRDGLCIVHGHVEAIRSVVNFFPMTGTPVLNRPGELFALLNLINDEAFPRHNDFLMDYCTMGWDKKWKWAPGGESRLINRIKGSYLRRTREDAGVVLPKQTITIHDMEFDREKYAKQAELLDMLKDDMQIKISEGEVKSIPSLLALLTRQRQAAVWPGGIWMDLPDPENPIFNPPIRTHVGALYQESAKMDRAVELAQEFAEAGERFVVFSNFREAIDEFANRYGDKVVTFHGGTSDRVREQIKSNFDRQELKLTGAEPIWDGVAAHYTTGGIGLNLTAATQIIILDETWSPGMNQQAWDRINRMGQEEETCVHILRLEGTVDAWLAQLIEQKRQIVDGFEVELQFQDLVDVFMKM